MKIDKEIAKRLVREQASRHDAPAEWIAKVEQLSRLCEEGISKTHIAFLATAMLAKACDKRVDLYAIKPQHAVNTDGAFSARVLCHSVLVPLSAELGINLGVTGREPLNNQPYFRMTRLDDGTPVHPGGRAAFDYMLELVQELQDSTEEEATSALGAFITVRRRYQPKYDDHDAGLTVRPDRLAHLIKRFVVDNSENGKRAQAVAAGLMDVAVGDNRVESGQINDPSRRHPGDVCVRSVTDPDIWEKAMEVRDKVVTASDVQIFGKKCLDMGVREAAVLMVSERQPLLNVSELFEWADGFGLGLSLFTGWEAYVEQTLFWSPQAKPVAAQAALASIHDRLVSVEASAEAITLWQAMIAEYDSAG